MTFVVVFHWRVELAAAGGAPAPRPPKMPDTSLETSSSIWRLVLCLRECKVFANAFELRARMHDPGGKTPITLKAILIESCFISPKKPNVFQAVKSLVRTTIHTLYFYRQVIVDKHFAKTLWIKNWDIHMLASHYRFPHSLVVIGLLHMWQNLTKHIVLK